MYRLFRHSAQRWQLLLMLVEFLLLVASVYAAVELRFWGEAGAQTAFGKALHWRASLVATVLISSMASLGLYQVTCGRVGWGGAAGKA